MWEFLKKRAWVFVLITILVLFPQSLSNQAKLNMKTLIPGMAIDKVEEGYEVTAQVVSPSRGSESGGGEIRATFISEKGKTVGEAVERLGYAIGKSAGLGHVNFLIVGEGMLEENLVGQLDYFIRDKKTSNSILLLTCDGEAKELIKKTEKLEASTGIGLQKVFLYKQQSTNGYMMPIMQVANSVYSKSKTCLVSGIEIEEDKKENDTSSSGGGGSGGSSGSSSTQGQSSSSDKPDGKIKYLNKLTCLVDGKKVGTLESDDEVLGFLMVDENTIDGIVNLGTMVLDGNTIEDFNVKYYRKKVNKKISFDNGDLILNVDINLEDVKLRGLNTYTAPTLEYYKEGNEEIENTIKEKIKESMKKSINKAFAKGQAIKCDIFELSDLAYQTKYNEWKKYIENNNDYLQKAKLNINVKIDKLT